MPAPQSVLFAAPHRTPRRSAAVLAVLSIVLASCSSGSPSGTSDTPETTPGPTAAHQGPLSEYLAAVNEAFSGEDASRALNVQVQEDTATCMAEAGFDYVPYVAPETIHFYVDDYGTREWVARRGYDLSGGMLEGPEREAWIRSNEANDARPPSVDPNEAIYAELSEGSKAAYDLALNGPPPSEDEERDESTPWSIADGCSTWATFVKNADEDATYAAEYADLRERMWATHLGLETHPRVVDLTTEWAHCMADAGHVYTSPTHAWDSVYAVIQGTPGPDGDPYTTSDEAKAFEVAVALADYDCKASVRWDSVRNSVIDEIEAQFLEDNKAEIDEYIDYVTQNPPRGS